MGIEKYNKQFTDNKRFNMTFEGKEYISLEEAYRHGHNVMTLEGLYNQSKGMYGAHWNAVTPDFIVNLPKHLNDTCKQIASDNEIIDDINNGNCGIEIYPYTGTNGNTYYGVKFIDF